MALHAELTSEAIQASRQNADEAAQALSRALDQPCTLNAAEFAPFPTDALPPSLQGAGLLIELRFENESALLLIPEQGGCLPAWYARPDATGVSKLTTLAQELGMLLLPESLMPVDFAAGHVANLAEALRRAGCQPTGGIMAPLQAGANQAVLYLLWPATNVGAALRAPEPAAASAGSSPLETAPVPAASGSQELSEDEFGASLQSLPPYMRSLLQIKVCVAVQLASRPQPVSRIVNMGPGSIVQFDRQCEQPLELFVNNLKIGEGEVVKVGDKFGLRVTHMTLPEERFMPLQRLNAHRRAS
jgi:flagellar motor switch protein FliN